MQDIFSYMRDVFSYARDAFSHARDAFSHVRDAFSHMRDACVQSAYPRARMAARNSSSRATSVAGISSFEPRARRM